MKRNFFRFCIFVTSLAICFGVFFGAGGNPITAVNASTITIDTGQTLFMRDGTHSATLRTQLLDFANSIPAVGEPYGRQNVDVGGVSHIGADTIAIREANGGDMPIIRMFEQRGGSVITGGSAQTLDQAADNFTMQQWMLMYITFPTTGHPIFTFMMTNPYRNQRFNPNPDPNSNIPGRNIYSQQGDVIGDPSTFNGTDGSDVRNQINYDFQHVLYQFDEINTSVFVTPGQLPGTWQSREPDVGSSNREGHSLYGARLDDKIWLPSSFELGDGNTGNLWGATRQETAKLNGEDNGFHFWAWMRSRATGSTDIRMFSGRDYASHFSNSSAGNARNIRPAIHLDMTPLIPALNTPTNVDINTGVLSWNSTNQFNTFQIYRNDNPYGNVITSTTREWTIPTTWGYGSWNLRVRAIAPSSSTSHRSSELSSAVTHAVVQTFTVTFNSHGGDVITSETGEANDTFQLTGAHVPQFTGHEFMGWGAAQDGQVTYYIDFDAITITGNKTLHAVWRRNTPISPSVSSAMQLIWTSPHTNFVVNVNGTNHNVTGTSFDLTILGLGAGTHNITILATGSGTQILTSQTVNTSFTVTQLDSPTDANIGGDNILSWIAVTGATSYIIRVNGQQVYTTTETYFDLDSLSLGYGNHQVEIIAVGEGVINSNPTHITLTVVQYAAGDDFPWLIIVGAVAGVLLLAGVMTFIMIKRRKRPAVKNSS